MFSNVVRYLGSLFFNNNKFVHHVYVKAGDPDPADLLGATAPSGSLPKAKPSP
jgi:hypothetical protein